MVHILSMTINEIPNYIMVHILTITINENPNYIMVHILSINENPNYIMVHILSITENPNYIMVHILSINENPIFSPGEAPWLQGCCLPAERRLRHAAARGDEIFLFIMIYIYRKGLIKTSSGFYFG